MSTDQVVIHPYVGIFQDDSVMYLVQILVNYVLRYITNIAKKIQFRQQSGLEDIDLAYRKCIMLLCSWSLDQWTQEYNGFLQEYPQAQDYYQYMYVSFAKLHNKLYQQPDTKELTIPTFRAFFCEFVKRSVKSFHVRQYSFTQSPVFHQTYVFSGLIRQLLSDFLYNVTYSKIKMVDTVLPLKEEPRLPPNPETPKVHNFTLDVNDNIIHDEVMPMDPDHQDITSEPPSPSLGALEEQPQPQVQQ